MTDSELECLKSHVDQHVEINTKNGECLLIKVISVFDQECDPGVLIYVVPMGKGPAAEGKAVGGYSLPLADILSVRPFPPE